MIEISGLNKNYKKKQVIFDFNTKIKINEGNIYGILGPNGAGKTTLLKTIIGILEYSSGDITVTEDNDYKRWGRDNIVFIATGERGLRLKNTVKDNVCLFAAMKGVDIKVVQSNLENYTKMLNFEDLLARRVETLSMGQKKKAMILCGLCTSMKVIIMDEPSNGLDIDAQIELKSLIQKIAVNMKKTFLISSHDLDLLSNIANKYIFIFNGRNVAQIEDSMEVEDIYAEEARLKEAEA